MSRGIDFEPADSGGTSYTDEEALDAAGNAMRSSSTITVVFSDAGDTVTHHVTPGSLSTGALSFDVATQAELDAHISDSSAAHAASAISADSTTLVGTGTDVQAVLEELDDGIADHLADATGAHAASAISFSPNGSIAATDVQAAIQEVRDEAGASGNVSSVTITYLTTTTTAVYVTPSGVRALLVEAVGGGGGGAGGIGGATTASVGSAGGAGAYVSKYFTATATAYTYYVGAGGAGGAAGANNGDFGTTTSFFTLLCGPGGGGFQMAAGTSVALTAGGEGAATASGGDINVLGPAGGQSVRASATNASGIDGGATPFGGGGQRAGGNSDGKDATGPGGGGSGGNVRSNATDRAGGDGANGIIRIWELW